MRLNSRLRVSHNFLQAPLNARGSALSGASVAHETVEGDGLFPSHKRVPRLNAKCASIEVSAGMAAMYGGLHASGTPRESAWAARFVPWEERTRLRVQSVSVRGLPTRLQSALGIEPEVQWALDHVRPV